MPVFFVTSSQIHDGTLTITGPLLDHLRGSLRTKIGDEFSCNDERQRRYRIRVTGLDRHRLTGTVLEEISAPPRHTPAVILAQAVLKGDHMDWAIQKATELGAAAIVPLVSARVIARPKAGREAHHRERWQRIALEAAQQAERWDVPSVDKPRHLTDFLKDCGASLKLVLVERGGGSPLAALPLPADHREAITLAVGPEGGWTEEEVKDALAAGCHAVTLGERILRAETAAVAALSIAQSRLGELGGGGVS